MTRMMTASEVASQVLPLPLLLQPIHVRAIRRMTISQGDRAERSIIDHLRIIEALEARDTELAALRGALGTLRSAG